VRVLVTGITGFVGRHLTPRLAADGHAVTGLAAEDPDHLAGGEALAGAPLHLMDLAAGEGLDALLGELQPEAVVHLAAQSAPGMAHADPAGTLRINILGTLQLLEAMRRRAPRARLLFVSSSEVYGLAGDAPLDEGAPVEPANAYGVSKAAGELLVRQCARTWGLDAIILRSFPHAGPGQRPAFALPAFARQLARIEAGLQEPHVRVGNLDARRDFTDVSDVAEAYARILLLGEAGQTYNLCSGTAHSIREGLDGLIALCGRAVKVIPAPELMRPLDLPILVGRSDKLKQATGWTPRVTFSAMLERILADWRGRVATGEDA
jgi:GDP-4-dehydro-6-deoxy-D-mannose reductase